MPENIADESTPPPSSPTTIINNPDSRIPKKTRDLPNLSECHNCNYRINTTNGKDKLQLLRSEWRIVLLCRKCSKLVNSGDLCPYCFVKTSVEDCCFRCCECSRRVHEHCVLGYKGYAPPGYFDSCCFVSVSRVCIDCWLPEQLLKSRSRAFFKGSNRNRKVANKNRNDSGVIKNSNSTKALDNVANEAKRKVVLALKAKDIMLAKVVAAKKAVEVANTTWDLVSKRDQSGENSGSANTDVDLAFQLHRELNSSRRITKCSLNTSCLVVPATDEAIVTRASGFRGYRDGNDNVGNSNAEDISLDSGSQSCSHENTDKIPFNDLQTYRRRDLCYLKYRRRKSTLGYTQSCWNEMQLDNIQSHYLSDCEMNCDRYYLKYIKRDSSMKETRIFTRSSGKEMEPTRIGSHCQSDCEILNDRYYLKYSRRGSSSKATMRCTQSCGDETQECNVQSQCSSDCETTNDRYYLKYSTRDMRMKAISRHTQSITNEISPNKVQSHCQSDFDTGGDRYYLKYSKRDLSEKAYSRHTQSFVNQIQPNNNQSHCQLDCNTTSDPYYLTYRRKDPSTKATLRHSQSLTNETHPNNIRSHCQSNCDINSDRYCLKYSKRISSMKTTLRHTRSCGNEIQPDRNIFQSRHQLNSDRYYLKYRKRTKV